MKQGRYPSPQSSPREGRGNSGPSEAGWKTRARELKRDVYALYLASRHPRTPWFAKLLAACVVAYAFSPIDLVPDFVPVLGHLDDIILVPLGVALSIKLVPASVLAECREEAERRASERTRGGSNRPRSLLAATVIVAIWLLLAALALAFFRSLSGQAVGSGSLPRGAGM
jgi:uncharacterized membrane protein YkvA (DUF1232 family)